MIEWADVVVANGEGAFYQDERKGKYILFLLYIAKKIFRKPVLLVNHMYDVKSENFTSLCKKIYPEIDDVVFRDFISLGIFQKSVPGVAAKAIPDAAFSFSPTGPEFARQLIAHPQLMDTYYGTPNVWKGFAKPFVILGGSSIVGKPFFTKNFDAVGFFSKLAQALTDEGIQVVLCVACLGDNFLKQVAARCHLPLIAVETPTQLAVDFMSQAGCFISGRYHPMILASVSGTPTIAFDSNSHKTRSLQELLDLGDQPYFELKDLERDIPKIVQHTKHILSNEPMLRKKILDQVGKLKLQVNQQVEYLARLKNR